MSRVNANAAMASTNHPMSCRAPPRTTRSPNASTTQSVDSDKLSVVMSAFQCNTPGASPTPSTATNATQRAALLRTVLLTVEARNVQAPTARRLCTITIARRLRTQSLASRRNPKPPGPA